MGGRSLFGRGNSICKGSVQSAKSGKDAVSDCRAGGIKAGREMSGEVARGTGQPHGCVQRSRRHNPVCIFKIWLQCVWGRAGEQFAQEGDWPAGASWVMAGSWRIRTMYWEAELTRISKGHLLHLRHYHLCFRALPRGCSPQE